MGRSKHPSPMRSVRNNFYKMAVCGVSQFIDTGFTDIKSGGLCLLNIPNMSPQECFFGISYHYQIYGGAPMQRDNSKKAINPRQGSRGPPLMARTVERAQSNEPGPIRPRKPPPRDSRSSSQPYASARNTSVGISGRREATPNPGQEGEGGRHGAAAEGNVEEVIVTVPGQSQRPMEDPRNAYISERERQRHHDSAIDPNSDQFKQKVQSFQRMLEREPIETILRNNFSIIEAASLFPDAVKGMKLSDRDLRFKASVYHLRRERTFTQKVTNELALKMAMLHYGFDVAAHPDPLESRNSRAGSRRPPKEQQQKTPIAGREPLSFTKNHKQRTQGREAAIDTPESQQVGEEERYRPLTARLYGYLGDLEYYTHLRSTACQAIRQLLWCDPKYEVLKFEIVEFGKQNGQVVDRWQDALPLNPDSRTWRALSYPRESAAYFVKTPEQPLLGSWAPKDSCWKESLGKIYWQGDKLFPTGPSASDTQRLEVRNVSYFPLPPAQPGQDALQSMRLSHISQHYTNLQRTLEVLVGRWFDGTHHCLFGLIETTDAPENVPVGYGLLTPRPSELLKLHPQYDGQRTGNHPALRLVREPLPKASAYFMCPGYHPPLKKAKEFVLKNAVRDHTQTADVAFGIIESLLRSCLSKADTESLGYVALVPHDRRADEEIVCVSPLQRQAAHDSDSRFTSSHALHDKVQQWAERMCMVWAVPLWSTRQFMHPAWVENDEQREHSKRPLPGLDCSLEDFRSQVVIMVTEDGRCPERYDPDASIISLKRDRGSIGRDDEQDAVPHSYSFQITPSTTEAEWRFIRPQITHHQLEVALTNPPNKHGPPEPVDWRQLVASYDPKKHASLDLSGAENARAGNTAAPGTQSREELFREHDMVASSKRLIEYTELVSARQDAYLNLQSVHGDQGPRIPFTSAPEERFATTADATFTNVLGVLTPSEQRKLGLVNQNLRNIALERLMFCPYQGCQFTYPVRELDEMRNHLEREHAKTCLLCRKNLGGFTPTAIGVHLLEDHGLVLKNAARLYKDRQEIHLDEPMMRPPFTLDGLRGRFTGEKDSIITYWLKRAESQLLFLESGQARDIPQDRNVRISQHDWERLRDFVVKASQGQLQEFVQALRGIASGPSKKQGVPPQQTSAQRTQPGRPSQRPAVGGRPSGGGRPLSKPLQEFRASAERRKKRYEQKRRGRGGASQQPPVAAPATVSWPSSNLDSEEPLFEVSTEHPTTYRPNGVVRNQGYDLFKDGCSFRKTQCATACQEKNEPNVPLPLGIRPGSGGGFVPAEDYHKYDSPAVFLRRLTIGLLGYFRYLCYTKIAFVQNVGHAAQVVGNEAGQVSVPAGLAVACFQIVLHYSPIVLQGYAQLAGDILAEKARDKGGSSPVQGWNRRIKRAEDELVKSEKTLRFLPPDAIVMDMEHGEVVPEPSPPRRHRGGGRSLACHIHESGPNIEEEGEGEPYSPTSGPARTDGLTASEILQQALERQQGASQEANPNTTATNPSSQSQREPGQHEAKPIIPAVEGSLPSDVMDIICGRGPFFVKGPAPVAPMNPSPLVPSPSIWPNRPFGSQAGHGSDSSLEITHDGESEDDLMYNPESLDAIQQDPHDVGQSQRTPETVTPSGGAKLLRPQDKKAGQVMLTSNISPLSLNSSGRSQTSGAAPEEPISPSALEMVNQKRRLAGFRDIGCISPLKGSCVKKTDNMEITKADEPLHPSQPDDADDGMSEASVRAAPMSTSSGIPSFLSVSTRRSSSDELDASYHRQSVLRDLDDEGETRRGPSEFMEDNPERYPDSCSPPTWREWKRVQKRGWAGVIVQNTDRFREVWHGDLYCSRCLRKMPSDNDPVNRRKTMEAHISAERSCRVPRRIGSIYYLPNQSGFISGDSLRSLKRPITRMRKAFKEQYPHYANTMYSLQAKHHNSNVWISDPNNEDNSDSWGLSWPPRRRRRKGEGDGEGEGGDVGDDDDSDYSSSSSFSDPGPISRKPRRKPASGQKRKRNAPAGRSDEDSEHDSGSAPAEHQHGGGDAGKTGKRKRQPEGEVVYAKPVESSIGNNEGDGGSESDTVCSRPNKRRKIVLTRHHNDTT